MKDSAAAVGVTAKPPVENYYRWVEPDSDITVCLSLEAVDRLQLEVLRGIESFSHSGSEVGGILLGRTERDEGRTLAFVDDFEPVACEHRSGPAYALTAKDAAAFETALAEGSARQDTSVLGYYRSHNRGGLFLSADDLQLIQRHFRGPDNVFLLIKTLTNGACMAGFFFWKDGHIQSEFTDSEAPLIPLSVSPLSQNLSSVGAFGAIPAAPPAPVRPVGEERPAIVPTELVRSRELRPLLIHGTVIAGVVAALTFAAIHYQGTGPAPTQAPSTPQPVPVTDIQTTLPAPTPFPAPPIGHSAPIAPNQARTEFPEALRDAVVPARDEPDPPTPQPAPESPAGPLTAVREQPVPPSPEPGAAAAERPPSPTVPAGTASAPPVPAPNPSTSEKPVTPAIEAIRTVTGARVVPLASIPPHPTPLASPPAHTFVGPQIIHQAAPSVPRSVWTKVSSEVQIDVAVAIDASGKVTDARVASSKGGAVELLTSKALKAAQQFRFQPAQENGRTVASSMVLTFRFTPPAK